MLDELATLLSGSASNHGASITRQADRNNGARLAALLGGQREDDFLKLKQKMRSSVSSQKRGRSGVAGLSSSKATRAAPAKARAAAAASVTVSHLADATSPTGEVESATIDDLPLNTATNGEESAPASATVAPKPAAKATIPPAPPPSLVVEAVLTSDAASPIGGSHDCAPRAPVAEPSCPLAIASPAGHALATGDARRSPSIDDSGAAEDQGPVAIASPAGHSLATGDARRSPSIDDSGAAEDQGPAPHQSAESCGGADASLLNRKKRRSLKRIDTARAALAQAVAEITAERRVEAASTCSAVATSTDPPWAVARDPLPLPSILTEIAPRAEVEVTRAAPQPSSLAQPPRSGQKRRRRRVSVKAAEGGPPPTDGDSTSDAAAPAALALERGLDGSSAAHGGHPPGADSGDIPQLPPSVGQPGGAERDDESAAAQPPQPPSQRKKKRRKSRAGINAVLAQEPAPDPPAPVPGPSRRPPRPAPQPVADAARPLPPPDSAHNAPRGTTGVGRGDRLGAPTVPPAAALGTQRDSQATAPSSLQSAEPKKRPLVLPPGVRKAMVTAKPRSRP